MKKITKYNKLQKKKTLALSILYPIYVTVFFYTTYFVYLDVSYKSDPRDTR